VPITILTPISIKNSILNPPPKVIWKSKLSKYHNVVLLNLSYAPSNTNGNDMNNEKKIPLSLEGHKRKGGQIQSSSFNYNKK
jgi:hypothetical protein